MLGLSGGITQGYLKKRTYTAPSYSLSLDGAGDYVTFTSTTFDIVLNNEDLSISFWAKRNDNNDEAVILSSGGNPEFKRLYFDDDGDRLYIESDQDGEFAYAAVTADTNWHHYVVVVTGVGTGSGGESTVTFYEDGSDITSSGDNTNFGNVNGQGITFSRIGAHALTGSNTREFKGLLHQLAIYETPLIAAEVTVIYNSGTPIPLQTDSGDYVSANKLLHLWQFNENTGSTTADSVGALTGTFVGNTAFSSTTP